MWAIQYHGVILAIANKDGDANIKPPNLLFQIE
jgi:hypothetical protein